jgi:hypothetical protein
MIMRLHLGVIDVPYTVHVPASQRRVAVRTKKGGKPKVITAPPSGAETTGDVATILEEKYAVMGTFLETVGLDAVAAALEQSGKEALEALMLGAPAANLSLSAAAESEIEAAFRLFLDQKEMDGRPGVPTAAALKGVNHRLAHPYAKGNAERPSFVDTGQYQQHFKSWMED